MSYYFEAVVVNADQAALIRVLQSRADRQDDPFAAIELDLHAIAESGFVVFGWRTGANRPDASLEIEQLAHELSRHFGTAVAVHYDDQCGVNTALLSRRGEEVQSFGEADEIWVPYDDDGKLITDGPRYAGDKIPEDIECDCIHTATDAALAAAGFSDWADCAELVQVNDRAKRNQPIWQRPAK